MIPIYHYSVYGFSCRMTDLKLLLFKVMEVDLLSLHSVARFAEAWNARLGPLHVLINNAGIFSIGGWPFYFNYPTQNLHPLCFFFPHR